MNNIREPIIFEEKNNDGYMIVHQKIISDYGYGYRDFCDHNWSDSCITKFIVMHNIEFVYKNVRYYGIDKKDLFHIMKKNRCRLTLSIDIKVDEKFLNTYFKKDTLLKN